MLVESKARVTGGTERMSTCLTICCNTWSYTVIECTQPDLAQNAIRFSRTANVYTTFTVNREPYLVDSSIAFRCLLAYFRSVRSWSSSKWLETGNPHSDSIEYYQEQCGHESERVATCLLEDILSVIRGDGLWLTKGVKNIPIQSVPK
jgi:hypothetical protein